MSVARVKRTCNSIDLTNDFLCSSGCSGFCLCFRSDFNAVERHCVGFSFLDEVHNLSSEVLKSLCCSILQSLL